MTAKSVLPNRANLPWPRQTEAHTVPAHHALYGGEVGGGKSDWLINAAHDFILQLELQGYHDQVLMLRRTFGELRENLDRALELVGPTARWQASDDRFVYPNGSFWYFGHVNHEEDVRQYRSFEFGLLCLDELTSFTQFIFEYLTLRNRSANGVVTPLIRAATNPGDIGHLWVMQYFGIENAVKVETVEQILYEYPVRESEALWQAACRHYPMTTLEHSIETRLFYQELLERARLDWRALPETAPGQPVAQPPQPHQVWRPKPTKAMLRRNQERAALGLKALRPPTRSFIPSGVLDNPSLSLSGDYESGLYMLSDNSTEIQAVVSGNWKVFKGQVFPEFQETMLVPYGDDGWREEPYHVIPGFQIPSDWPTWRALDWGSTAPYVCLWLAWDKEQETIYVYQELYQAGLTDRQAAELILSLTTSRPFLTTADPASFWRAENNERTRSLAELYAQEFGIVLSKGNNDRIAGLRAIKDALAPRLRTGRPGLIIFEACENLVRTLPGLVHRKLGNLEDVDDKGEDHAYDALRYGVLARPASGSLAPGTKVVKRRSGLSVAGLPGGRSTTRIIVPGHRGPNG